MGTSTGGSVPEGRPEPVGRPNIVLIVSDDHGTDALGSYGNPVFGMAVSLFLPDLC